MYDVVDDLPHLRVENRVLPAGPTVVDILTNAAFYYGLVRVIASTIFFGTGRDGRVSPVA